ncbi:hypothetical protein [Streptomyces sp. SM11]|uniref:hypothetical protein n=1 Tax=Streptomyces sp. SM11 TaxID=565557 RepID=UPI0021561D1E|nr:hypothetical protein [Streptomyces sp. SM11]
MASPAALALITLLFPGREERGPLRAATEGFSLTLTIAAGLLVLGAVLIAVLLAKDSAVQPDSTAREPSLKPV